VDEHDLLAHRHEGFDVAPRDPGPRAPEVPVEPYGVESGRREERLPVEGDHRPQEERGVVEVAVNRQVAMARAELRVGGRELCAPGIVAVDPVLGRVVEIRLVRRADRGREHADIGAAPASLLPRAARHPGPGGGIGHGRVHVDRELPPRLGERGARIGPRVQARYAARGRVGSASPWSGCGRGRRPRGRRGRRIARQVGGRGPSPLPTAPARRPGTSGRVCPRA
jgi:hypothetical protein